VVGTTLAEKRRAKRFHEGVNAFLDNHEENIREAHGIALLCLQRMEEVLRRANPESLGADAHMLTTFTDNLKAVREHPLPTFAQAKDAMEGPAASVLIPFLLSHLTPEDQVEATEVLVQFRRVADLHEFLVSSRESLLARPGIAKVRGDSPS